MNKLGFHGGNLSLYITVFVTPRSKNMFFFISVLDFFKNQPLA